MNLKLETEFSKAEILQEVDALKKQIDDMRPLPADVEGRVMQKLRLDWNYHSNAIEGNKLSYGETVAFLMEGITAKGKPLKDHLDIRGHNEAINFLLSIVKDTRQISEADIRALHTMILVEPYDVKAQTSDGLPTTKRITLGEYKTLSNHVQTATGETHYYATPEDTPAKMQELMEWFTAVSADQDIRPVVAAALFHHKFVSIHPFDDGNGRLSRILMNLILMRKGYPPVVIKMDDRTNYYSLLSRADNGNGWPFIEYVSERLVSSLELFLKAAKGGDIDEDEDVMKQIALYKMELNEETKQKFKRSIQLLNTTINESIVPTVNKVLNVVKEFEQYFDSTEKKLVFYFKDLQNIIAIKDWKKRAFTKSIWTSLPKEKEGFVKFKDDSNMKSFLIKGSSYDLTDLINDHSGDFTSITLTASFFKFKKENRNFDITIELNFELGDEEYIVKNSSQALIFKGYNQKIDKKDDKIITAAIFDDIKYLIDSNLNR